MDPHKLVAGKHGSRAALADVAPELTVPADRPHEIWTLDEKQAPVYIRGYHPNKRQHVAVKIPIILAVDNFSRAIVSYRGVPPFKHGAHPTYTEEDIFGTLLGGMFQELAPPATRDFSGYVPRTIRWDRHSTHRTLATRLKDNGIEVPDVPGSTPWTQGRVERLVGTMKTLCQHIKGWDQAWLPAGEVREEPSKTRSKAATGPVRETTKKIISTRQLLTYREFMEEFDKQVRAYNDRVHSVTDMTPEVMYFNGLEPDACRPGYDFLPAVNTRTFRVTKKGLTYRGERFAWESGGRRLRVGETVRGKPDPLLRGLFVEVDDGWEFMPRLEDYARKADHKKITIDTHREVKEASRKAHELREQRREDALGPAGVAEAEAEMEAALEGKPYPPNAEPPPEDNVDVSDAVDDAEDEVEASQEPADTAPEDQSDADPAEEDELERRRRRRGLRSPSDRIRRAE